MAAGYAGVGTVNISGSVTSTETVRTPTTATAQVNGAASSNLGTVPAGKKWTILGYTLSCTSNGGGTYECYIEESGGTKRIARLIAYSNAAVQSQQAIANSFTYANAPQYAANEVVRITGSHASGACAASIQYYEENA